MRKLSFIFIFLYSYCLNAQTDARAFLNSPSGVLLDFVLPPLEGPADTTLYFCTNGRVRDSIYYKYNTHGKLIEYQTYELVKSWQQYKAFQLGYDSLGRLNLWEHLPDATNNGERYQWSYNQRGAIANLEAYNTSLQGQIHKGSIQIIDSDHDFTHYWYSSSEMLNRSFSGANHEVQVIDFHSRDQVDSSYFFFRNAPLDTPSYKILYHYDTVGNKVQVRAEHYSILKYSTDIGILNRVWRIYFYTNIISSMLILTL